MTLRDDVRDYFEREARRFPAPSSMRIEVAARPSEARVALPTLRLAGVVAFLLALAIIVGLLGVGRLRQTLSPQVTPGRVHVKSGEIERLLSIDLNDAHHGWALIQICDHDVVTCQYWVESFHNDAEDWFGATRVGPSFAGTSGDSPRFIHFANTKDGFVYGLGVAYVTHDGGSSWSAIPGSYGILAAIVGSTTLWMVSEPCVPPSQCLTAVRTSVDGGRTWSDAAPLPVDFQADQAFDFGTSGLLLGAPTSDMAITKDGGRTWRSVPGRCSPGPSDSRVDTPDGSEIWELCATTPLQLSVSDDGGATWSLKPPITVTTSAGQALLSPNPGVELLITGLGGNEISEMLVSTDHGGSWRQVPSGKGLVYVAFGADGYGWAFDGYGHMFKSADYGLTWTGMSTAL
jgi:hypothetical protein